MTEKLQGLLEKIKREGLDQASEEKKNILADAEKQAAEIVKKANADAAAVLKSAEDKAAGLQKRAETALQQASRDIMLKLKSDLQSRLDNIVRDSAAEALTPQFMAGLVKEMAIAFAAKADIDEPRLELLVAQKDCDELEKVLLGSLPENFKKDPEILGVGDIGSGLKLGFKGSDVFFDFTDDAVADLIGAYIGPRLAAIINAKAE